MNPFLQRIIHVLIKRNDGKSEVNIENFISIMSIFCYSTAPIKKKSFLFQMYDYDNTGNIPINELRNILSNELFVRSHYSEID